MKYALTGYSFQKQVTLLLLCIMDVERNISKIEIEANTLDNFDDLVVTINSKVIQFQIKDFENIKLQDLKPKEDKLLIKGRQPLVLSSKRNILFFKNISFLPNGKFMGFDSYELSENITILSLSRVQIDDAIDNLYINDPKRRNEIDSFFNSILDKRIWEISREILPRLKVFVTELQEQSVKISHKLLQFDKLLLIEGKPGVGKTHFANTLIEIYEDNILYRFWISNQDRDYKERLKYVNFIRDLNTKLFDDQKIRTVKELLAKLKKEKKVFIIDGLDHVENYNKSDFESFIDFINNAKEYCTIIVLSRPLVTTLEWKKHTLANWNFNQTKKVLEELFHLSEYSIIDKIYKISLGYPIIVKYVAEHYKLHKTIPLIEQVENIDSYYQQIVSNEKGKQSLSLFLCSKSYIMKSEIDLFIGEEKFYVNEFIDEHPYLFDIKLNRISLFHDSFNTFLRNQINYSHKSHKVNRIVSRSILNLEKRFLSRFGLFNLSEKQKKDILIKYSSIETFKKIIKQTIDYESIRTFYDRLRETLNIISYKDLTVIQYYDLSLILNLVLRDHISTLNTFYYTYVKSLIENGITDDDITSSEYLFGMYYYIKTKNAVLLLNQTADDNYIIKYFYNELENDIYEEENHIKKHSKPLNQKTIKKILKDNNHIIDNLTYIIENVYINNTDLTGYKLLKSSIEKYIYKKNNESVYELERFLEDFETPSYYPRWILKDVYNNLLSYGLKIDDGKNEYQDLTLKEIIAKYSNLSSFNLRDKIHNHIRLALLENRKNDIHNIYPYWIKYYQRKDYTLYSLPIALKTLENEGIVSLKNSIKLINKIQNVSEKGYRHLLHEFTILYKPEEIIPFLENNFDRRELFIEWFKLPTKYINNLEKQTYNIALNKLMEYNRDCSINFDDLENVLHSKYYKNLELTLSLFNFKISFKKSQKKIISKFKDSKLFFNERIEQNSDYNYKRDKELRFNRGIIDFKDLEFIKKKKLKPYEVVKYSDGYYTSLPDINFLKIYDSKEINKNFQYILYNSLIRKTESISNFYALYYHPGNILAMIKHYRNNLEFKEATSSFKKYIELSMFRLKIK